jgi:hypothetical protein
MSDLPPDAVTWIGKQLVKTEFVTWDRFIVSERQGHTLVDVYGWIDRDDDYKDFVWVRFWPDNETFEYTTSSDEYSKRLGEIWFGESNEHSPCQRVEDTFDIPNRVELE